MNDREKAIATLQHHKAEDLIEMLGLDTDGPEYVIDLAYRPMRSQAKGARGPIIPHYIGRL